MSLHVALRILSQSILVSQLHLLVNKTLSESSEFPPGTPWLTVIAICRYGDPASMSKIIHKLVAFRAVEEGGAGGLSPPLQFQGGLSTPSTFYKQYIPQLKGL